MTVTVTNVGSAPALEVGVVDTVPGEFDVLGVPILDGLVGQNLISVGNREQIVWSVGVLEPGQSLDLPWFAQVMHEGDLAADNTVAAASTEDVTRNASRTYLGGSTSPQVAHNGGGDRSTTTKRVRRVVRYRTRTVPDVGAGSSALPFTGAPAFPFVIGGIGAIMFGALLLLLARRRRFAIVVLCIALLAMTACVDSSSDNDVAQGPSPTDTVLGKRLHNNGDRGTDNNGTNGDDTRGNGERSKPQDRVEGKRLTRGGDVAGGVPGTTPTQVAFHEVRVPVFRTVTVTVPAPPTPAVPLTSLSGGNTLTFAWDEPSRTVTTATSSVVFDDQDAEIRVDQDFGSDSISNTVTLTNVSDHELAIDGRLVLDVSGPTGAHLTSPTITQTIAPGGSVTTQFRYVLPSGSYTAVPSFEAG
ncbi:MAG TPA: hypothetical protein VFK89_03675 [Actinomycetota bacterium]|nr:hypothetical protein [Actinomycetota bacterium]